MTNRKYRYCRNARNQYLFGNSDKESKYILKKLSTPMEKPEEGGNLRFSDICICLLSDLTESQYDQIHKIILSQPEDKGEHLFFPKKGIPFIPPIQLYRRCFHRKTFHAKLTVRMQRKGEQLNKDLETIAGKPETWAKDLSRAVKNHGLPLEIGDKSKIKITIELDPETKESISEKNIVAELTEISNMIAQLKPIQLHLGGFICPSFLFDEKEFNLANNLKLPTDFYIPQEHASKIGKIKMTGFALELTDSPVGIVNLNLGYQDNCYLVEPRIEYALDQYENFIKSMIDHSFGIAKEFVVKRNV